LAVAYWLLPVVKSSAGLVPPYPSIVTHGSLSTFIALFWRSWREMLKSLVRKLGFLAWREPAPVGEMSSKFLSMIDKSQSALMSPAY